MQIITKHFEVTEPEYQQCLDIRLEVLRKPLGMVITEEDRQKDAKSTHVMLSVDGQPAGTVSLMGNVLRQMAVLDKYQGLGLGAKLVRHLEGLAKERGLKEITLDARYSAIPFYEKLGYECCSDIYDKIGIKHRDMRKDI